MRNALVFALVLGTLAVPAISQHTPQSRRVQVLTPSDLPDIVRQAGQAMDLHVMGNGKTLLYVEQAEMKRVAIVDVTDAAHVRAVGVEPMAEEIFDFVRAIDARSTLVRFRDSGGFAVMDYRVPLHPKVVATPIQQSSKAEWLGESVFLVADGKPLPRLPSHDYQVMDAGAPGSPQLVATIPHVEQVLNREATGTTFLLGSEGLTVIRQPRVEQEYRVTVASNWSN